MTKINVKINKLPKSAIEIEGQIEAEIFESYFNQALKKLGEKVEVDGFRKGKVPENVLLSKIPEMHILEEMAEMALSEHYPKIIEEEKLDLIARPEISITKLARHNPLEFKIKTAVLPEVKLPEYKNIAKKIISEITEADKNTEVTDKEIEDTIMDIRKSRAPKIDMKEAATHTHAEGEKCDHEHPEPELPEFNDAFVQALGPFKNIADFKEKLKENIKLEKENQFKEKTRLKIVEKIITETKMELPDVLIDLEVDKIVYRMEADIAAMGLKLEDYLKHINKTIDDIKKEFRGEAEKKAKLGLILNEIAKVEKITADPEQVAKEVAMILEHYKDADKTRAEIHAENVLTNEAVFKFLEQQ